MFQYSEKEDKYEEEIKVLSDKLKEVQCFCFVNDMWGMMMVCVRVLVDHLSFLGYVWSGWDPSRVCRENSG